MRSARSLAIALAPAVLAAAACAPSPRAKLAEDVEIVRREETSDKLLERGKAFAAVGDLTRAEQYFAASITAGADPKVVLPLLLQVCVAEQRYWVAIDYAEPHLKREPENFRLRFVVASLYANIGDAETAQAELERVVAARPDYPDAHYALGVLLRDESRDLVGADAHFREYLRLEPKGAHAAEARGSLLKTVPPPTPQSRTNEGSGGSGAAAGVRPGEGSDGSAAEVGARTPERIDGAAADAGAPAPVPVVPAGAQPAKQRPGAPAAGPR